MIQLLSITVGTTTQYALYDAATESRSPIVSDLKGFRNPSHINLYEDEGWLTNLSVTPEATVVTLATFPSYYEVLLNDHSELFI